MECALLSTATKMIWCKKTLKYVEDASNATCENIKIKFDYVFQVMEISENIIKENLIKECEA